jgi:hypothetical protein
MSIDLHNCLAPSIVLFFGVPSARLLLAPSDVRFVGCSALQVRDIGWYGLLVDQNATVTSWNTTFRQYSFHSGTAFAHPVLHT